jgi:hypothetical protein
VRSSTDQLARVATRTLRYVPRDRWMLPLGAELRTSMNPFAAKIWIGARAARHTSTCGERTTIVPNRVLPEPAKWRSACPPDAEEVRWVDAAPGLFAGVAAGWVTPALVLALRVCGVRVREEAPVFARALPLNPLPVATVAGGLCLAALPPVLVEPEPPPPPQPPSAIAATGKAAASAAARAAAKLSVGEEESALIVRRPAVCPSGDTPANVEVIESTSSSRAPAPGAAAAAAAAAARRRCPSARPRSAPSPAAPPA